MLMSADINSAGFSVDTAHDSQGPDGSNTQAYGRVRAVVTGGILTMDLSYTFPTSSSSSA